MTITHKHRHTHNNFIKKKEDEENIDSNNTNCAHRMTMEYVDQWFIYQLLERKMWVKRICFAIQKKKMYIYLYGNNHIGSNQRFTCANEK